MILSPFPSECEKCKVEKDVEVMRVWFSGRTRPCQGRERSSILRTPTKITKSCVVTDNSTAVAIEFPRPRPTVSLESETSLCPAHAYRKAKKFAFLIVCS